MLIAMFSNSATKEMDETTISEKKIRDEKRSREKRS